jgi:hypothetical protein
MPAGRKLFLTHAGELAHRLVSAIARDAMAMEFVRRYAERHDRLKVVANVQRLREVESTISREALLLIAADVRRQLPQAFGFSRNPRPEELALCDVFYTEFLEALGRSLEWPAAEAETEAQAFRRDLETYIRWRERNPLPLRASKAAADQSPFPDRCAILLDSAMMEQARRAAKQFQSDLVRLGMRTFGQLGRYPSPRRRPSATKSRSAANHGKRRPVRDRKDETRRSRKPARSAHRPRRGR